jgi:hypothetical protein
MPEKAKCDTPFLPFLDIPNACSSRTTEPITTPKKAFPMTSILSYRMWALPRETQTLRKPCIASFRGGDRVLHSDTSLSRDTPFLLFLDIPNARPSRAVDSFTTSKPPFPVMSIVLPCMWTLPRETRTLLKPCIASFMCG